MSKNRKRVCALLLSGVMLLTQLPMVALAAEAVPEDGAIASFEPLDSGIAEQTVPVGTDLSELDLPDALTAAVYRVSEDTLVKEDGTLENDAEPEVDSGNIVTNVTTTEEQIPVTWDSAPAYDGNTPDKYVFTADVDGYDLADDVEPPQIAVTVTEKAVEKPVETQPGEPAPCAKTEGCTLADGHEGDCVPPPPADNGLTKTITSWTFLDNNFLNMGELAMPGVSMDHQASFDNVVSMLPTKISAEIQGETDPSIVDLTGWTCDAFRQDGGNWPTTGEYTFAAALPEGYACDPLPAVNVLLGGTDGLNGETGSFTVTGGLLNTDYKYESGVLTILKSTALIIAGSGQTTTDTILVPDSVTASVTLQGVNIDVSGTYNACAFAVEAGGEANVTLAGANTLKSGLHRAGLEVPENATLTLTGGDGDSLEATGGSEGAGIGGGRYDDGGTIKISGGSVTATGINGGAGIGGGSGGGSGNITIIGGRVRAASNSTSSGLNVESYHSNGTIIIGGTAEVEALSYSGAGIGGGGNNSSGAGIGGGIGVADNVQINISGSAKVKASSTLGAGIGGGDCVPNTSHKGDGGKIIISGGTVTATSSNGAGIGGGSGDGGTVKIFGQGTTVTAGSTDSHTSGHDVGSGYAGSSGGSLSVTDGAKLEMEHKGTDVTTPEYKSCTIIDWKNDIGKQYDGAGNDGATLPLWDGSTDASAKGLGVQSGGTIHIRGNGSATLTIDVADVTVTSGGRAVSGPIIKVANGISSLTIRDLDLTARDGERAISFASDATLTVEGTCAVTGGATAATYVGNDGIFAHGILNVNVGNGGFLHAMGGDSSVGGGGGYALAGSSVKVQNDGTLLAKGGKVGGKSDGTGIFSGGDITLTGLGITTTQGASGINTGGVLTVNGAGKVTANGTAGGVFFENGSGYRLAGDGTLIAAGIDGTGDSYGIVAPGDLELAFTGSLTAHGGPGTKGHGMLVGRGLTVSAAPTALDLRPGAGTDGYALSYDNLVNKSHIPDGVFVKGGTESVDWPACAVAYAAPDKDGGTVPETVYRKANTEVTVPGNPGSLTRSGYVFAGWEYAGTTYAAGEKLTMPNQEIILKAVWTAMGQTATPTADPKGGVYSVTQTVTLSCATPNATIYYTLDNFDPTTSGTRRTYSAPITVPLGSTLKAYAVSPGNTDSGVMTETYTKQTGGGGGGGGGSYTPSAPKDSYQFAGDSIRQQIPRSDLKKLSDTGKRLTLSCDKAGMAFDSAALKAILAAVPTSAGNITFAAAPTDLSGFPDAAALIGSRPAYNFTISYKDNKGITATAKVNFPAGSAAVTLNYSKTAAETEGSLFMVYVDEKGAVTWLDKSSYDSGKVLADAPHFSTYGVAYKSPAPVFTDTANHWAKADIEFVAARGLLSGTGNNLFSPDTPMTRGMFVTVFYRLAGSPQAAGEGSAFTDVPVDAYYADAVAWANQNKIVNGIGGGLFAPGQSVTREQMAVILANYAKAVGFELPSVYAANVFADGGQIGAWARDAVKQMQMAGVLMGKDGNRFDPQGTATRAEASAMLHRFVERMIDASTAQGWTQNDSGQWLYYMDGKPVKSQTKEIAGEKYAFDTNGVTLDYPRKKELLTYTVKAGDSFWGIARAYNVSVYTLAELNGKTIYSLIHPGDVLKIPQ